MGAAVGQCCADGEDANTEAPGSHVWSTECSSCEVNGQSIPTLGTSGATSSTAPARVAGRRSSAPAVVAQMEVAVASFVRQISPALESERALDFARQISSGMCHSSTNMMTTVREADEGPGTRALDFVRKISAGMCQRSSTIMSTVREADQSGEDDDYGFDEEDEAGRIGAAAFANHCYFYNLEIRGRRPRCEFQAGECGQVHERIPDHIFQHLSIPSLEGAGSDASLREIFSEIDTDKNGKLDRPELQQFITARGVDLRGVDMAAVMKLLSTKSNVVLWDDFCLMGRLSLQWHRAMSTIVSAHAAPKLQESSAKKLFLGAVGRKDSWQETEILALFQKADVHVDQQTVRRASGVLSSDGNGILKEPEVLTLLEGLCVVASIVSPAAAAPEAADVRARVAQLVRAGVSACFKRGSKKPSHGRQTSKTSKGSQATWVSHDSGEISDGMLGSTKQELQKLFVMYGVPVDGERLDKVVSMFDDDGNGSLESAELKNIMDISMKWHEFMTRLAGAVSGAQGLTDAALRREFLNADADKSGSIGVDELRRCFANKGVVMDRDTMRKVMVLADVDNDESIGWREFRRMFTMIDSARHPSVAGA